MVLALLASAGALLFAEQKGGIVPTEYRAFDIAPGPEPDVVFFATGEVLGKIEPCG